MLNIKKTILFSLLLLLLVFGTIFFLVFRKSATIQEVKTSSPEQTSFINENESKPPVVNIDSSEKNPKVANDKSPEVANDNNSSKTVTEKSILSVNQSINKKFPELGLVDFNSFLDIAINSGNINDCHSLDKEAECEYYFAIYTGRVDVCGHMHNKTLSLDCYKELAPITIDEMVNSCNKMTGDNNVNCLNRVFSLVEEEDHCSIFKDQKINQLCLDILNYKKSFSEGKEKCSLIKGQSLKDWCFNFFTTNDSDNDKLSDEEETVIGTNPYQADTDKDGFSDKEELDKGYNPCGDGNKPTSAELFSACKKLY